MKTIKSIYFENNNILVSYTDDIGATVVTNISDGTLTSSTNASIQSKLDALPIAMAKVSYVSYKNDVFTITGVDFPPVLKDYSELSNARKLIIDDLKAKIFEVKGVNMTELYTKFGSNLVTINGTEYPYSDFISTEFANAITLANQLYNGI
jgi:hypothetical protein